jgi:AraC-like DNA-binding protein
MDVLSEVLRVLRLEGALYFQAEFSAPWMVHTVASEYLKQYLAPAAGRLMIYHLITEGRAFARTENGSEIVLEPGDVLVLPHGHSHHIWNGTATKALDADTLIHHILQHRLQVQKVGGGGEVTRLVCGYMACDAQLSRQLLGCLPPIFKVNIRTDDSGRWIEQTIRRSVEEGLSSAAGADALISKLSEVLFIEMLRRYIASVADGEKSWLGGVRDAVVGRALACLHSRPAETWTVEQLAKEVGTSRSVLAEKFTEYLGESPIAYLMQWRMQLAAQALSTTSSSVLEVAMDVGYQSEAAFNRAFRREFGVPPARYRAQTRATPKHR